MENYGIPTPPVPAQPPGPRRQERRWLVVGSLALALALALGVGTLLGLVLHQSAQAAAAINDQPAFSSGPDAFGRARLPMASMPGAQGLCTAVTVTSVNGQTIVGRAVDGSTLTIHTTASTQYRKAGQAVTASAVTVGSQISVMGTRNSDGSITATSIDVR